MKSPLNFLRQALARITFAGCIFAGIVPSVASVTVDTLRCEYLSNPLGIDASAPGLSWLPKSSQRGESVSAYQILVASSAANLAADNGDLWNSGKIVSQENVGIAYGGAALPSFKQVFWKVRLWNQADSVSPWSAPASWTMGVLNPSDWTAQWITPSTAATDVKSTLLRREFNVDAGLVRALVNVTGLGEFEMSLNGSRVGEDLFAPGWTEYDKTVLYSTYDITTQLKTGANAVGLMLGNGMYNIPNNNGRYVKFTGSFGPRKAIAQIRLEYANGTVQTISTDANWKWSNGPITFNTTFGGEDYDARLEQPGWNMAGFADASWAAVTVTTGPGGTLRGASYAAPPLRKQAEVFKPTPALSPTASGKVYDFVQNASNIPTMTVYGPAGATVRLSSAEVGSTSDNTISQITNPSYSTYTLKGSTAAAPEVITPRFVYLGYRYLKVDISGGATIVSLTSTPVHSSAEPVGDFSCSKPLFNDIRRIIRWAQRSNLVSLLTDCPHREKLGWLEQYHLHGPSMRYEFDLAGFFRKTYTDMADSQLSNGLVPDIAPEYTVFSGDFRDSPEWGSSFVLSPEQNYDFYGDLPSTARHYANIKRYVDYLTSRASGNIVSHGLGDWYDVGPGAPGYAQLTPKALTATAIYYADVRAVAAMAQRLGNTADASAYTTLASNIRNSFDSKFYNSATGSYSTGSQTANAMPLALGMVLPANKAKVVAALVAQVREDGNSVTAGDVGHRFLLRALADAGRSDVIYDIHSKTTKPGYGYILSQGYTALTEGWDGSSSKNHFMLGHIMEWFYHDLAGIQSDPAGPGFKKIIIKPTVVGDLTSAMATYKSVRGMIASAWTISGSQLNLTVTIPPGTTAAVYLPLLATNVGTLNITESGSTIMQNGAPAGGATGVAFREFTSGSPGQNYAGWNVQSGTYQFSWQFTPAPPMPAGLKAAPSSGQISLSWSALPGATSYSVKRATVSGGPYQTIASNLTATSFVDAGLQNGTVYYYVFNAVVSGTETMNSDESSSAPTANLGFELPAISTYQYNPTGAGWAFVAQSSSNGSGISANGSGFTSSNAAAPEGTQIAFLQGTGTVTQAITGLMPGAIYAVKFLAAQRASSNGGGQTWQVKLDGSVIGTYAPAQSATAYAEYSAPFTATSSTHTLAFVGTNTRGGDNTIFLDNVRFVITSPPAAPTGLSATGGFQSVRLNWNAVPGAASYGIKRAPGGGTFATLPATPTIASFTDTGLANGTSYSYLVFAVNSVGNSADSNPASATPQAPPITAQERVAPTMNLSADGTSANVTITASIIGHAYQLQYCDNLPGGVWTNFPGVAAQNGNGAALLFNAPVDPSLPHRFYRLGITLQP